MLTFEEFFAKKKIDLAVFSEADPELYSEFRREYDQMGAKSFDQSKKFLFNKLRRAYHLQEEPKSEKPVIEMTEIASQALPLESPTIVQKPAYTPRFRPKSMPAPKPEEEKTDQGDLKDKKETKPAYKPQFNIKNIKPGPEGEST